MKYPEQLFVYCNENDDCSWDCNEQETWNGEVQYVLQSEYDCLQERVQELETERRWIPVSERLPETMQKVEVIFKDRRKYRATVATYIKARTVMACDFMDDETPPEALDYDETIDDYWAVEGFWEDMWTSDGSYCIEEEIIYWRPLPLPQPQKEGE
jgi:hypothetical protein